MLKQKPNVVALGLITDAEHGHESFERHVLMVRYSV